MKSVNKFQFQLGAIGSRFRSSRNDFRKRFQFQLGAIGRRVAAFNQSTVDRFNSSLVRLGDNANFTTSSPRISSFNSSLVRLGGPNAAAWELYWAVSIPAWCDWENAIQKTNNGKPLFQFQLGAIGRVYIFASDDLSTVSIPAWCDWEPPGEVLPHLPGQVSIPAWCDWEPDRAIWFLRFASFNSSLVRLGARSSLPGNANIFVSIPAWCDWEADAGSGSYGSLTFQFQLGAIGRYGRTAGFLRCAVVSIPAWCDWERNLFARQLVGKFVSIPAWCDWEFYIGRIT